LIQKGNKVIIMNKTSRNALATLMTTAILAGTAVFAEEEAPAPMVLGNVFDVAAKAAPKLGQMNPAVSFDGKDTFLVVWEEGWDGLEGNTDIKAARVKADGTCLDPEGIAICQAKDFQERPAVAWCSGQWLVVWQDIRSGKDYDVYGARISAAGKCLDPDSVPLYAGADNQCQPAVAANGTEFCLAWCDFRGGGGYRIRLGRVSPEGKPLNGDGVVVQRPFSFDLKSKQMSFPTDLQLISPRIVWGKGNWLVTFLAGPSSQGFAGHTGGLRSGAWSPTLEPLGNPVELYIWMRGINHPALAIDGDVAFATFSFSRSYKTFEQPLTGVRLDAATGRQLETSVNGLVDDSSVREGAIDQKRSNLLAIYKSVFWLSGPVRSADAVAAGSGGVFLAVSSMVLEEKQPARAITAVRVRASDGKVLEGVAGKAKPVMLTANDNSHLHPAIAAGKDGQFLVLWEADRGPEEQRIEARFVQAK
jgi:hypothetical protein